MSCDLVSGPEYSLHSYGIIILTQIYPILNMRKTLNQALAHDNSVQAHGNPMR